ncbi:MAG: HRDC domain-containing protein, partial [Dehalococcoidia bacterium]|nr:HRDC domain-containing protein [Dehalococcoidia bacterium]
TRTDFGPEVDPDDPLIDALRAWRSARARTDGTPAYTLFSDRTLRELVGSRPSNRGKLLETWGLGESRVDRFGDEILQVIAAHQPAHP